MFDPLLPLGEQEEKMAQTGYEEPVPGDAAPKVSGERARQGQNVKGMIWVLIIGVALVVVAYAVMLALGSQSVTPDNRAVEDAAIIPPAPVPAVQETLQSPQ